MAETLLKDTIEFKWAVENLKRRRKTTDEARQRVCRRSRFLKDSVLDAVDKGGGTLLPLATWIDELFRQAMDVLARKQKKEDVYLRNVRRRYLGRDGIKPLLDAAMNSKLDLLAEFARQRHGLARQQPA